MADIFNYRTADDLQKLVDEGADETTNLEFKAIEALQTTAHYKKELAKDVSAMANAAGGTIIYGIDEVAGGVAGAVRGGPNMAQTVSWIEQVLNSGIEPRIEGITITKVDLADGSAAVVVDVPPDGDRVPHQETRESRYYRRYNREILRMSDNEIRALLGRRRTPRLFLVWNVELGMDENHFKLNLSIGNHSPEPALYTSVDIYVGDAFEMWGPGDGWQSSDAPLRLDSENEVKPIIVSSKRYTRNIMIPNHMPIFAERRYNIMSTTIVIPPSSSAIIGMSISTPGFAAQSFGTANRFENSLPVFPKFGGIG